MGKIPVQLGDGNAFSILGACSSAMKKAGVHAKEWKSFHAEATSGDYNHLLRTVAGRFDIQLESETWDDSDEDGDEDEW
jgi:hypothetical protein